MKIFKFISLAAFIAAVSPAYAQYEGDALLFSRSEQGQTSRLRALGGAQTAVGGDISSLSGNPAGLGLFTKSEIGLSLGYSNNKTDASYLDNNSSIDKNKLNFNQLGGVFVAPTHRRSGQDLTKGLLSVNFGIGYNRTNDFNTSIRYGGNNTKSSISDYFAELANDYYPGSLPEGGLEQMAYNNYAIDYDNMGYFSAYDIPNKQGFTDFRTGSQSEVDFAIGANYSNKFYFGAGLGIANINYNSDKLFTEDGRPGDYAGQDPNFVGGTYALDYNSYQQTRGTGVNLKLGIIYRITNSVRFGLNFISPTWYNVDDTYSETLTNNYNRADGSAVLPAYTNEPATYQTTYNLRTPLRLNAGLAATIANSVLLSGDAEYVDYSSINFSSSDSQADQNVNNYIQSNYKEAVNVRLGAEFKLPAGVALRGGYNYQGSPYKTYSYNTQIVSGGLGYRVNNVYLDLTYQNVAVKSNYTAYVVSGIGDRADLNNKRNNVFLTVGTRF